MIAKLFHISTEGSDHGHKPRLKRKYIYYALTAMMGVVVVSVRLNTQLVIVNNLSPESSLLPWELVLMGWGSFIYAMGSLFLASLSDRFGRLPCIAVTAFILAGLNVILGWNILGPYQLWHLFLCWGMVSLCFSIFFTGVEGLLSEYQDHSMPLARRLGLYCISWSTGGFVASFLTGYGKELLGPEVIFMSVSLVCFAVLTVTLLDFLFHGTRKIGEQEVGEADIRPEAPFHASLARIGLFFGSLAFAALSASFPRFARDFHQLGEGAVGSFLSTITFTAFLTFAWFPLWNWWHYRAKLQVLLQGFMLAGLILLLMAPRAPRFLFACLWCSMVRGMDSVISSAFTIPCWYPRAMPGAGVCMRGF